VHTDAHFHPAPQVASKRVTAAKSERFYKQGGKKKAGGFWSGLRKQLSAHPIVVAIIFFIMIFSGEVPACYRAALLQWQLIRQ
jgi:hypothetical protein